MHTATAQRDRYTPDPPDTAHCPTCGTATPGAPVPGPTLDYALARHRCPICGQVWNECRDAEGAQRFWSPAA